MNVLTDVNCDVPVIKVTKSQRGLEEMEGLAWVKV